MNRAACPLREPCGTAKCPTSKNQRDNSLGMHDAHASHAWLLAPASALRLLTMMVVSTELRYSISWLILAMCFLRVSVMPHGMGQPRNLCPDTAMLSMGIVSNERPLLLLCGGCYVVMVPH